MKSKSNMGKLFISSALVLMLVLGAGCEFLPQVAPSTSTPASTSSPSPIDPNWTVPAPGNSIVLPSIADAVAKVRPSVVAVNVQVTSYDIFAQPTQESGAGSGWVIREDGIIITNNHVIEGADTVSIVLDDGREFSVDTARIARDPVTDLAVLKINTNGLPAVTVGDPNKLRVGDWVVAIGNSLGLGITAKEGIISRKSVNLAISQEETLYNLLETSAAINPGNSGGPLVNLAGEVIGITSAKIATSGVEGMGYAISASEATPIIQQLINTGHVVRPWLGVGLYTVDEFVVRRFGLSVNQGAFVTSVGQNSPAEQAGLKVGDVITRFKGKNITSYDDLVTAIHSSQVGETVEITYWRGNNEATTTATLMQSPAP